MARKKIREYDAKRVLKAQFLSKSGVELPIHVAQVNASTDFEALISNNPWLLSTKLVVKPDMLFGQRGKNDLVGLNLDYNTAIQFIRERLNKIVTVNGCTAPITTFIIEPFVPHQDEFYMNILSTR
jgi:ATP citrate (pro-S)-lyase